MKLQDSMWDKSDLSVWDRFYLSIWDLITIKYVSAFYLYGIILVYLVDLGHYLGQESHDLLA